MHKRSVILRQLWETQSDEAHTPIQAKQLSMYYHLLA